MAVEIIGHRGAGYDAPENTLSSFELAFQQGADGVELDIHLTKDGRVVAIHDASLSRTGRVPHKVAEHSFEELREFNVGSWGRWKRKGHKERIPALEEVVALIPEGKRLVMEIKCGPEVLPSLGAVLRASRQPAEQTVIIGFAYETMRLAKAALPERMVLWLAKRHDQSIKYPPLARLIRAVQAAHLDGLDLEAGFPINQDFVEQVHQTGLKLYTWTVDKPVLARKLAAAGVDAITTNRPGWLRAQLTGAQAIENPSP
jgi:glycerophosphoryl diester phosphodiesterase